MGLAGRSAALAMLLLCAPAVASASPAASDPPAEATAAPAATLDQLGAARDAAGYLSDARVAKGELDGALDPLLDEVDLSRRLAAADPSERAQRGLMHSLNRLAWLLSALSDLRGAQAAYDEEVGLAQRLAATDPKSARAAVDVAATLEGRGDVLMSEGDLSSAAKDYAQALAFDRKAALVDPTSAEAQRDVALALQRVGDVLAAQDDKAGAVAAYQDALERFVRLAASGSGGEARDLAMQQGRVGERLLAVGDPGAARAAFEASVSALRAAAIADPSSAGAAHDLELQLNRLSYALRLGGGDPTAAMAPAEEALAIARRLAAADPASPSAQADLVFALGRYGDLRLIQHDNAGARDADVEALGIEKALARSRPEAVLPARSVGELMAKLADIPGGGVTWAQVVAYAERMQARGLFRADDARMLAAYRLRAADAAATPGSVR